MVKMVKMVIGNKKIQNFVAKFRFRETKKCRIYYPDDHFGYVCRRLVNAPFFLPRKQNKFKIGDENWDFFIPGYKTLPTLPTFLSPGNKTNSNLVTKLGFFLFPERNDFSCSVPGMELVHCFRSRT